MSHDLFSAYPEQAAVPETLRLELRKLWARGAKPEELAATFKLPLEWVMDFVLEGRKPRSVN
jgi:hypothetical protein